MLRHWCKHGSRALSSPSSVNLSWASCAESCLCRPSVNKHCSHHYGFKYTKVNSNRRAFGFFKNFRRWLTLSALLCLTSEFPVDLSQTLIYQRAVQNVLLCKHCSSSRMKNNTATVTVIQSACFSPFRKSTVCVLVCAYPWNIMFSFKTSQFQVAFSLAKKRMLISFFCCHLPKLSLV